MTAEGSTDLATGTRTRRFTGFFPARLLVHRAPRWWQEIALIAICYYLYSRVRNLVPEQETIALRHGRAVQHLQDRVHLSFELSVNKWVAAHEPVAQVMNYYYATLHFVVTIGVLVWLFRWRPRVYRGARTVLFGTSLLALIGFWLYPLAPPRLLPQYGYIDTLLKFHTWGSLADPKVAEHSNQYAAMAQPAHRLGALVRGVHLSLRPAALGAAARGGLPVVDVAGHRRDREPLLRRCRRRRARVPRRRCGSVPAVRAQCFLTGATTGGRFAG